MPSFTNFLALLALAGAHLTTAFKIPDNQPDGVYLANTETGEIQLQQRSLNDSELAAALPSRRHIRDLLQARTVPLPVSNAGCPPAGLNPGDYLGAYANFAAWCDKGNKIGGKNLAYATVGSAVWYGCSYGGQNPCGSDEVSEAEHRFNDKCGVAEAAWIHMKDWKKTYGRDVATAEICGNL
ncbi:hypothetical protein V8F06_014735 [Rhypophila decipiens]